MPLARFSVAIISQMITILESHYDNSDSCCDGIDPRQRPLEGIDHVADPERVADLIAVVEDRKWLVEHRRLRAIHASY
jgi:hypothetical protein